ncbi:MAG: four helix bundle protein [Saprospiraceae bacterium]|nr:four helix bundle protein [Saprospiraceae bacterium]
MDMGKFKELRVWQDSVSLAERIYLVTREGAFSKDYGLRDQIQRAVVSIASNLAEGDERGTNREAVHFFNIAKGSSAEVVTQLNIAYRIGYLDKATFEELENEAEKIRASIRKLIQARGGTNPLKMILWPLLSLFIPI